jgi:hypothetical protein
MLRLRLQSSCPILGPVLRRHELGPATDKLLKLVKAIRCGDSIVANGVSRSVVSLEIEKLETSGAFGEANSILNA